jgi:ketosteroid isomerase-like protein
MQTGPADRLEIIRGYYTAYENDDRSAIEPLLHPDFTFSSPEPDDNRIDRTTYFERCWPNHKRIISFELEDLCADASDALIRYRATDTTGPGVSNTEHFEFTDGLISHIDVYFGRSLSR